MKIILLLPLLFTLVIPCYSLDMAKQVQVQENPKRATIRQIYIAKEMSLRAKERR
jgi:hypothetical protein